jgi:hypothetical protein
MWRRMERGIRLLLLLFEDTCVACNHSRDQSEEYLSARNSIIMQSLRLYYYSRTNVEIFYS